MEETVLEGGARKRGAEKRQDKSLKDLRGGEEKGNRAEGGTMLRGLLGLGRGRTRACFQMEGR